jgi:hypothetical protein
MKTIKNSKEITTLEVGDKVIFGDLKYIVTKCLYHNRYYLELNEDANDRIFRILHLKKEDFIEKLGINADYNCDFPETKSLEALTAIVSALFKEYEKQNALPKTWEEFCERNTMGDKRFCLYDGVIIGTGVSKNIIKDSILIDSPEEAQAFRALMQLRQLRKAYVKGWDPDWMSDIGSKYCIEVNNNELLVYSWHHKSHPLSFPSRELAKQFLNNFKDLLEIAKPLL